MFSGTGAVWVYDIELAQAVPTFRERIDAWAAAPQYGLGVRSGMRRFRIAKWLALGAVAVCGLIVGGQLGDSQLSRGTAVLGIVVTAVVTVAVGLATWKLQSTKGGAPRKRLTWHDVARFTAALIAALSAGYFADSFFAPRGAVESEAGIIEHGIGRANDAIDDANLKLDGIVAHTAPRPWRAFDNIAGLWGEEGGGCRVVYRFERRDHGLIVSLSRKEAGMSDYRMTASILPGGRGDVLRATIQDSTETDEDGRTVLYDYLNDGVTERLAWRVEGRDGAQALRLEPCRNEAAL